MSHGIVTFSSVADALKAGYQLYEKNATGFIVRKATENGWAQALVVLK